MDGDGGRATKDRRPRAPNVGEIVGLAGVAIAGLGLYLTNANHENDRRLADQTARQQAQARSVMVLRADGEGNRVRLAPANPSQVVQSQTFYFPSAVRPDPVQITGEGHVDVGWFAAGLKRALHGAADNGAEHSLPVGVATTYVDDGEVRTDQSLYQIGFTIHPRLLQGAVVRIEGVALSHRGQGAGLQAAANAAWAREAPAKP